MQGCTKQLTIRVVQPLVVPVFQLIPVFTQKFIKCLTIPRLSSENAVKRGERKVGEDRKKHLLVELDIPPAVGGRSTDKDKDVEVRQSFYFITNILERLLKDQDISGG